MSIFFYIENKYLNAQKFDKLINIKTKLVFIHSRFQKEARL